MKAPQTRNKFNLSIPQATATRIVIHVSSAECGLAFWVGLAMGEGINFLLWLDFRLQIDISCSLEFPFGPKRGQVYTSITTAKASKIHSPPKDSLNYAYDQLNTEHLTARHSKAEFVVRHQLEHFGYPCS